MVLRVWLASLSGKNTCPDYYFVLADAPVPDTSLSTEKDWWKPILQQTDNYSTLPTEWPEDSQRMHIHPKDLIACGQNKRNLSWETMLSLLSFLNVLIACLSQLYYIWNNSAYNTFIINEFSGLDSTGVKKNLQLAFLEEGQKRPPLYSSSYIFPLGSAYWNV